MEERFEKHRDFLVDRIDPDFGLLDKLLASKTLTREAVHKIKLKDNTPEKKNRILLDFLLKDKKADELITALRDSGQTHLVNYLNADGEYEDAFGDDWPLSETEISRLDINRESLVDLLDTSDLCVRLFSAKVINNRQKQYISSKSTDADRNEALLDMLTKCSLRQYKKTIDCLNDSNQSHISALLSEGGVLVRVHANLEDSVGNVDEVEEEIISQFTRVLENHSFERVTRLLDLTQQRIIAARKGQSIVVYIHCTTNDELLQLIDLLKADRLRGIIERVFTELLSTGNALKVTLTWSVEEFRKAASYFESADLSKGRSATPKMVKIVKEKSSDVGEVELQSEGKSDTVFVQSITTNETDEQRLIRGFTLLDEELFIVSELSSEVKVYDSIRFSFIRRWNFTNLIDPQDIGSCYRNKCLYIFDFKVTGQSKEILRVDPNGKLIKNWSIGDDWGYGLSVTEESNVILTVCNKIKLSEYSSDGRLIREINLSSVEDLCYPFHAIKLTTGNFLVSYNGYHDLNGVCIVDSDGKVEKSFSGEQISTFEQIIRPVYLAIDRKGSVFVVDQENSRVLLLNSDLEFHGEILSKEKHGLQDPEMILLDEANGRLFVAENWDEGEVLIFECK